MPRARRRRPPQSAVTTQSFRFGLKLLCEGENDVVDIVFVHGLTGDRERTWMAKDTAAPWPQTLLPSEVPNARILTFGYDAEVTDLRGMVSKNTIANHSMNLLTAVAIHRVKDDTNDRPLMFVCHSLGGLVCQDALSTAQQRPERHLKQVLNCTRGLIFLGTPHHGSGLAEWAERLAKAIGVLKQTNTDILTALRADSEVLARVQAGFHTMIRSRTQDGSPPIEITCFYEELPLPGIGTVVPAHSAILPGYIPIGIHSNHMDMTKFESKDDPGFTAVVGELYRWTKELIRGGNARPSLPQTGDPAQPMQNGTSQDLQASETHVQQGELQINDARATSCLGFQTSIQSNLVINSTAAGRNDYTGQFSHSSLIPVKAFVPRPSLGDRICAQLSGDDGNDLTKRLAVWGLGGVGKTQLVLDYVQKHRKEYKAIFWIEAGQKESLHRDIVNLYQKLWRVQMSDENEAIIVEKAVDGVKSWFEGHRGPWLMVFDSADEIENSESNRYIDLRHFIPDAASLHVIVTSRSSTAKDMMAQEGVEVREMEETQAMQLFDHYAKLRNRHDNPEVEVEVKAIMKELGYLALAVTLAGTYVGRNPSLCKDIKGYLPEYRKRRRKLLERRPQAMHQYGESVLTTWETSYQAIYEQSATAATLLTMLSFFNFDDLFPELFSGNQQLDTTPFMDKSPMYPILMGDIDQIKDCFEPLQQYSLVQWKEDQDSYTMHKLVHAWGFDRLNDDEKQKFSIATLLLLLRAINECSDAPKDKLRLVPHVMANFTALVGTAAGDLKNTLSGLSRVVKFLTYLGRFREAYEIQQHLLTKLQRILGDEHPDTVRSMSNLASILHRQGQLEEAAEIQKKVLEKQQQTLGDDHPDTIAAMNNLTVLLYHQGQHEEAARIHKKVLQKQQQILGDDYPGTISIMSNLASILHRQGQLEEAVEIQKKVLEKRQQTLGDDYPDILTTMNNLAATLHDQGQLEEAAEMQKKVLEKRQQILGDDHPDTITAMNNLAIILCDQGQPEEAAEIQKKALEKQQQILGHDHPNIITTMDNLAVMLCDQGQLAEAISMYKKVLEKQQQTLGNEHSDTITTMSSLASILHDQGQLEEAAEMQKKVLEKQQQILGNEHPDTITVMSNLAAILHGQGQLEKAAEIQKKVLEKQQQILGNEHPDTITAMSKLAFTLSKQGLQEEAVRIYKEVLEKQQKILGDEHPDTVKSMRHLASILHSQGQLEEAAEMQKKVLEKQQQILGNEHPGTITAMGNLALALFEQGLQEEAERMYKEVLGKQERVLGKEHPDTIMTMYRLACVVFSLRQQEEAVSIFQTMEERGKRALGAEHPTTKLASDNLALIQRNRASRNRASRNRASRSRASRSRASRNRASRNRS